MPIVRKSLAALLAAVIAVTPAIAAPGVTTTDVNFRSGPGTKYQSLGVLSEGTKLDIGDCNTSGSWCAVTVNGSDGFVSGKYLNETEDPTGWPRTFDLGGGASMVIYAPQFTSWENYTSIKAVVAAEYLGGKDAKPQFGVIGVAGKTARTEDGDEVVISDLTVAEFNFAGLSREEAAKLSLATDKLLPTGPVSVAETRIAASLADQARMVDAKGLKGDPPKIVVTTGNAILVQTNGEAAFAPVSKAPGLSFLVNTNWDVLRVDESGALYLRDETHWLTAASLTGDWTAATSLPDAVKGLPDDDDWKDARAAMPPEPFGEAGAPKVVVTDEPAEMISFDGEPKLEAVPDTTLEWASNTESDVFFDQATTTWYVLLSGRWFSAASLDGPWAFATPNLPADFQKIPEDAVYHSVRSSVPGTPESDEARLRASIPTTARVKDGAVTPEVAYAGDAPKFVAIDGTSASYAQNTTSTVIQVGTQYFLLQDGVWFVSDSPDGPWALAREVPDTIYEIPPSSPVYNVTYVRVYETEPDAVWYGYTMGYLGGLLAWGTLVYGTGWRYPPYWYPPLPGYRYPIYYPRPVTWGVGAYYNPVRGAYGRYGYRYGPYRGIAGARTWNPRTGTYTRRGAVWGPRGRAGFVSAYNPRLDAGGYVAAGRGVYGRWASAGVTRGSDWARATARQGPRGTGVRWGTSAGNRGFVREGRRGDIYAGRDGNVYRRTGDGWQTFDGGWQNVNRPDQSTLLQRGEGLGNLSPQARERLSERGGGEALQGLAAGAAGGAAGAALGSRLANRPAADRGTGPVRRPNAQNRPAQRPNAQNRPAGERARAGGGQARRPAETRNRPAAQRRPAPQQRRAAPRRAAPRELERASRQRQVGNQRRAAYRSSQRQPQRRAAPRGGGVRRGGGGARRGGGGRGRR